MQELQLTNKETMSSVEIAELTGKRHDHVMTDVRKMLNDLEINAPDFSGTQQYGNNNSREVFNLPKRECLILVSGYNVKMRAAIIDRWQELENGVPKLPQTKLEWMRLAVETEEALQLEASAHVETKRTLKLADIRQIHERHISLEYMVVDIRNQQPEFEITYRDLLKKLREHKMIRKYGVLPLLNQNKAVPFTIRTGGDGSGNRISYIIPEERAALISWYASKTNQDI